MERHSLAKDESDKPDEDDDPDPDSPPYHRVRVGVLRVPEDSLVQELAGDVGVDGPDDQGGDEHEGERGFACPRFGERADDRGGGVLADVEVPDCGGHTEGSQIWGEQDCLRLVWNIDCL